MFYGAEEDDLDMVKIPIQRGANLRTQKKGKVLTEAQSHSYRLTPRKDLSNHFM